MKEKNTKNITAQLLDQKILYQATFNGVNDAIFVETLSGQILDVNPRACEMFGWTRDEFLAKTVRDLVPPENRALIPDEQTEADISTDSFETVNMRADGERFPVEVNGRVVMVGDQPLLLVVVRDITRKKDAESALLEAKEHAERLFRLVPSAIFTVDRNGLLTSINQNALGVIGYEEY